MTDLLCGFNTEMNYIFLNIILGTVCAMAFLRFAMYGLNELTVLKQNKKKIY